MKETFWPIKNSTTIDQPGLRTQRQPPHLLKQSHIELTSSSSSRCLSFCEDMLGFPAEERGALAYCRPTIEDVRGSFRHAQVADWVVLKNAGVCRRQRNTLNNYSVAELAAAALAAGLRLFGFGCWLS